MKLFDNVRFKKLRLWIFWPYCVIFIFFAATKDLYLQYGIPAIILGLVIRLWASGYIEKSRKLAICGPYAFVRNPLYVGNFLLGLGFTLFAYNPFLLSYYIGAFWFVYYFTVKKEEAVLLEKFGDDFKQYKKEVPAFLFRLKPYRHAQAKQFNFKFSVKNGEWIRVYGILILLAMIYFRDEFLMAKRPLGARHVILMVITLVLMAGVFWNIKIRRALDRKESQANRQ
ncbi:MAG: isoprenylcysteine carboxylmethyltransferase family protein [Candidatus Omnitrophota bacterium]